MILGVSRIFDDDFQLSGICLNPSVVTEVDKHVNAVVGDCHVPEF